MSITSHVPVTRALVDCRVYVDGRRLPGTPSLAEARARVDELGEGFVWVALHEPDIHQMREVGEVFGLHRIAVDDAVRTHQRPKIRRYDDTLYLVLKTVKYVPHESISQARDIVGTGEVMIFAGCDFVVTVRHGDFGALARVREEMNAHPHRARLGPFAIVHAVTDHLVDEYRDVSLRVGTDVDVIEEQMFAPRSTTEIDQIYLLKREVLELRRAVQPLSGVLREMVSDDRDLIGREVLRHLHDVIDHQSVAAERINTYDVLLTSLVTAAVARAGMQQNLDLRKISSWVAIASVPTMIGAVYGMNFDHMPELHWAWGYPAVLGVTVTACVLLHRTLRRNHWL